MPRGQLIVFEGPHGTGKSTQLARAARALTLDGMPVFTTKEPTPRFRELIARLSSGATTAWSLAAVLATDRLVHYESLQPVLAAGTTVLCDRYVPSSLVYQSLHGVPGDAIHCLNAEVPLPDGTLYFHAPYTVRRERLLSSRIGTDFFLSEENLRKEDAAYADVFARYGKLWHASAVDAAAPADGVAARIRHLLDIILEYDAMSLQSMR